jgi:hypothetical protein
MGISHLDFDPTVATRDDLVAAYNDMVIRAIRIDTERGVYWLELQKARALLERRSSSDEQRD